MREDADGNLYGTTSVGGANGVGTIFKLTDTGYVAVAAAVPEAGTWGMMILGFGMMGAAMRRRVRASEVRFDAKIKSISEGVAD